MTNEIIYELRKANKFISTKHLSFNHKYIPVYMTPCQTLSGETSDIYCAIPGACLWLVGINKLLSQPGNDARREPHVIRYIEFYCDSTVQCHYKMINFLNIHHNIQCIARAGGNLSKLWKNFNS